MLAAVSLAGCAGARIEGGVFRSPTGYRVAVPAADWDVTDDTKADLQLRSRDGRAAMLANAACEPVASRQSLGLLTRHVLFGLRERAVAKDGTTQVNGRTAAHMVVEGRMGKNDGRVRVESFVLKDERCVYDLLYVAAPEVFETWRPAFRAFVDSFAAE